MGGLFDAKTIAAIQASNARAIDRRISSDSMVRRGGHDTSIAAAAAVAPNASAIKERIVNYAKGLVGYEFTDADMDDALNGNGGSTYRSRRAELTAAGVIVDSGQRVKREGERRARILWRLKTHG